MKKKDLRKLAIIGLSSGLLISTQVNAASTPPAKTTAQLSQSDSNNNNDGNLGYHDMSEDELLLELSPEGAEMYNSLTPEGKELARKVASMRCNKTNSCKGLNACQTATNSCAGKGACRNTGKCAIGDKNLAVKLARDKMAQKRANASTPSHSNNR